MISTTNLVTDLRQVPTEWIFEYYLQLSEKLVGQDVKMHSVFVKEKTPSFCIYYNSLKGYKFKDFSSGKNGDAIEFVQEYFNLSGRGSAALKIMEDYSEFISNNETVVINPVPESRYQVSDYEIRHWNNLDQDFWTAYKISSRILSKYNVRPLKFFVLSKLDNNGDYKELRFENNYTYGYFKNDGTLYKIYQPKNKKSKFIKVSDYIQGSEQLALTSKYLVITKSLKDIMTFDVLGIGNVEVISPDSENSLIQDAMMQKYLKQYKKIVILFDNDEPGVEAAKLYNKKYNVPYIILPFEKDVSDTVKARGVEETRNIVFTLLKSVL
jgi:hypothetical protein